MKKKSKSLIIVIVSIILLAGGITAYVLLKDSTKTEPQPSATKVILGDDIFKPASTPSETVMESETTEALPTATPKPEMLPDMAQLYLENPDTYAKIKIEGTVIDYPVMYSGDDYYVNHNFYKNSQRSGCLFIDRFCLTDPRGTNLIIHGHHMKSGIMFGSLEKYADEDFYKEHKIIDFTTLYEEQQYEIFAVFRSQVYKKTDDCFKFYQFYNAENEEEFNYFVDNCLELSLYDTGIVPEYGDELITLNTCEYSVANGRFVVVARKIKN